MGSLAEWPLLSQTWVERTVLCGWLPRCKQSDGLVIGRVQSSDAGLYVIGRHQPEPMTERDQLARSVI